MRHLLIVANLLNLAAFHVSVYLDFVTSSSLIEQQTTTRLAYERNVRKIEKFNQEKGHSYKLRLNPLANRSAEELEQVFDVSIHPKDYANLEYSRIFLEPSTSATNLPTSIDWRNASNRVSKVKNNGNCGSSWAFAAVGVLEGQEIVMNKKVKTLVDLSAQNLIDCALECHGCFGGGTVHQALQFVANEKGINSDHTYPYVARQQKCQFDKRKIAFSNKGFNFLPQGDEEALKRAVAEMGPVAVHISADFNFVFYSHGIYYRKTCRTDFGGLNYALLVVGYGSEGEGKDYWIAKNDMSSNWGEDGYIRLARNRDNNCGIATLAVVPTF